MIGDGTVQALQASQLLTTKINSPDWSTYNGTYEVEVFVAKKFLFSRKFRKLLNAEAFIDKQNELALQLLKAYCELK